MKGNRRLPLGIRIPLVIIGITALIVVIFGLWVSFPIQRVPIQALLPNDSVVSVVCDFDSKKPGIELLKSKIKNSIVGKYAFVKYIPFADFFFYYVFPKQVLFVAALGANSGTPQMEAIISMNNSIRFYSIGSFALDLSLFNRNQPVALNESGFGYTRYKIPLEKDGIAAYSIIDNSLIIGNDPAIVAKSLKSFKNGYSDFSKIGEIAAHSSDILERHDVSVFMDNSGKGLSRLLHAVEAKTPFAAFASIDSVDSVIGFADVTAEKLSGRLVFECSDRKKLGIVGKDVTFFYAAIRRILGPRNLDITGDVTSEDDSVIFAFTIAHFIENFFHSISIE